MARLPLVLFLVPLMACASGDGSRPVPVDLGIDLAEASVDEGVDEGVDMRETGPEMAVDMGPPEPGMGQTCEACTEDEDCADRFFCVDVGGGRACLPQCVGDVPECPPRFECVDIVASGLPERVCAPVGERCCVDPDGDLHGTGLGCLGVDCDEEDDTINASAVEVCDAADNDCNEIVDDGDPAMLCPGGDQVATTACVTGNCAVVECVEGFDDCDEGAENGCETSLDTPANCGGCDVACAPANAMPECRGGVCGVEVCLDGFGDCDGNVANGCERPLNSVTDCGVCGRSCSVLNAIPGCDGTQCTVETCNAGFADCDGSPLNGCETNTTSNANCGGCGVVCAPANGFGECSTGSCRITSCSPGVADCDGNAANGCETNTRTLTDCGGCGLTCTRPGGMASCATGTCEISGCAPLQGDCDGIGANGCETSLATTSNCGGCGLSCSIANGTGTCPGGSCGVSRCNSGFDDCDGTAGNGCEARLNTLTNCGGCGNTCNLANASESCSTGSCRLGTCSSGFGNCDGNGANGCERRLNTLTSCGGCGTVCNLPGASESCSTGSCRFLSCNTGFSSCDGNTGNGCELNHGSVVGSCGSTTVNNVGAYDGDRRCGFICGGNTGWDNFATLTGRRSAWYRAILREDSSCDTDVEHRIQLDVPSGVNFDLYLYEEGRCGGAPFASSTLGTGANEEIIYRKGDGGLFSGDSQVPYFIEVRYVSGRSCEDFEIRFDGHDC
ncbi:MAG: putative metal-binding motif-containing protein [Myxococcota bacterium]